MLSYPAGAFAQQVTIAAGATSGIRMNAPVMTGDGLIGRVTNVGHDTAQVTLLTDRPPYLFLPFSRINR